MSAAVQQGPSTVSSSTNAQVSAGHQLLRDSFAAHLPDAPTLEGCIELCFTTNPDKLPEEYRAHAIVCAALPVQEDGRAYIREVRQLFASLSNVGVKILARGVSDDGVHLEVCLRWRERPNTPGLTLIRKSFQAALPNPTSRGSVDIGFTTDITQIDELLRGMYTVCEALPTEEDIKIFIDEFPSYLVNASAVPLATHVRVLALRRRSDQAILGVELSFQWSDSPEHARHYFSNLSSFGL